MTLIKSESGSRGNGQDFNKQLEFYCLAKLIYCSIITITGLIWFMPRSPVNWCSFSALKLHSLLFANKFLQICDSARV